MLPRLLAAILIASPCASLLAGEIQGQVTDEQGAGLAGVRICLALPDADPGECSKTKFTNKKGSYSFNGIQNVSRAGLPVPVILGETVVGSIVISAGIDTVQLEG